MPSALPAHASLPSSVRVGPGHGGLPVVFVAGRTGSAEIYLHGAHVTHWAPAGAAPVIWMSAASRYVPDAPLRGGVPLCFPWFGAHDGDAAAPAHGFARLLDWELADAQDDGDDVVATFRLADSPATRSSAWPHRFEARYTVTVGARLTLALEVTNLDPSDVMFEEALHTYLRVSDIASTEVTGLEGAPFLDRLGGPDPQAGEDGPVRFAGETDRIYLGTRSAATVVDGAVVDGAVVDGGVVDGAVGRRVRIDKLGSGSTVVWNPWVDKSAAMADFGDDEWTTMVCVETCNIRTDAVRLAPGQSHTMTAVLGLTA
ncbi:D-hexose-6-phosphate mutarotase [Pengzhenrongella frigida]|uniref:Putative glucose-6-phosphate 1-epimerase n=1 Tax=Pengzhenrongella frigida TaxID=1259133 RepID=A0A4Q5N0R4_9MICO|nr:D-hexose-6-phosphate mutarotase [Cellulomonas sp. HLT2-17]RYV50813.1 D-hexose-6-phosphate mutarotase [Cellulomonas sp. HLT2-17]